MRVNAAFKRLLDLPGVTVTDVSFQPAKVVMTVKLRSGRLRCPECSFSTRAGYDRRTVASVWRHLDLGHWRLEVRAELRRLTCPVHQVRTEGVGVRPGRGTVHPRPRGPRRVAGHDDGQDGVVPPGAHRLGQRGTGHRAGDGHRHGPQASRQAVLGRRRRGVVAQGPLFWSGGSRALCASQGRKRRSASHPLDTVRHVQSESHRRPGCGRFGLS